MALDSRGCAVTGTSAYLTILEPSGAVSHLGFTCDPEAISHATSAASDPLVMSVEVCLDRFESGESISHTIRKLVECCPAPARVGDGCAAPPQVEFAWGSDHTVTGYVTAVAVHCSMFDVQGTPVRASCMLTIHAWASTEPRRVRVSGPPGPGAPQLVEEGASLASIANRVFGESHDVRRSGGNSDVGARVRLPPRRRSGRWERGADGVDAAASER
jgi:hypothetical protein